MLPTIALFIQEKLPISQKQDIAQMTAKRYASADGSLTNAYCANAASAQRTQQSSHIISTGPALYAANLTPSECF